MLSTNVKDNLFYSFLISFILLILFFTLQISPCKEVLKIEPLWVLIAFLPLIVTILFSGLVKTFKGFGIELETNLSQLKIFNIMTKMESFSDVKSIPKPEIEKKLLSDLEDLPNKYIKERKRIQFIENRIEYYGCDAVLEYFKILTNLQYIEIVDSNNKFVGLLTVNQIYKKDKEDKEDKENLKRIKRFIEDLEEGKVLDYYEVTTQKIKDTDNLLSTYKFFKNLKKSNRLFNIALPIVDSEGRMIGTVTRCKVTDTISENIFKLTLES